jgi:pyridoxamine 5'-phosphate oxidase
VDPLVLFRRWFAEAEAAGQLKRPGAVCVSTVDLDAAPDARFVDLKEITDEGFVFGTRFDSPKGLALARDPRIALTFWWDHIEKQVRVAGTAERISDARADALFRNRSRDAQLVSCASQQSAPLADPAALRQRMVALDQELAGMPVPRPREWGGYLVIPERVEFLTFRPDRTHERRRFSRIDGGWKEELLQP